MTIWQSARLDEVEHGQYGWLGRALDARADAAAPHAIYAASGPAPPSLWGRRASVASLGSLDEMSLMCPPAALRGALGLPQDAGDLAQYVARSCDEAFTTAERLATLNRAPQPKSEASYGQSNIAQQLKLIAALVKSGSPARVFYTSQSGYDTHATQLNEHSRLLRALSDALAAFLGDMAASGLADRVLVLAFSEFGRRAAENDSLGTDHGAAAPVFVAGPKLAGGIIGPAPNLSELQEGDVRMAIDFRQVYATILDKWLGVPPAAALAGDFEQIRLFS